MREALGLIEIQSWTVAMAALDAMEKCAAIRLLQVEINDLYGVIIKIAGTSADARAAIGAGKSIASLMEVECVSSVIDAPDDAAQTGWMSKPEFNPLIQQDVVHFPHQAKEPPVSEQAPYAIGLIETQGFTAVIEAIDTAVKAGNVEVIAKEKLGGGYVTIVIKGDVAAVKSAIEAGKNRVRDLGLGKLIAAHVIARPSAAVIALLPKVG